MKWRINWKLTPMLKYAGQYAFCGQNTWRVYRFIVKHRQYMDHTQCHVQRSWIDDRCLKMIAQGKKASYSDQIRHCAASGRHYSQKLQIERSTHSVFGKLKEHLGGRQFSNDGQVQTVVLIWPRDKKAIFYPQGIERLVKNIPRNVCSNREIMQRNSMLCVSDIAL